MVCVFAIAISVSACREINSSLGTGTTNASSSSSDYVKNEMNTGPVTIRTNIPENEMSNEQIKQFEDANPNIKIERVILESTKLEAQIATGDAPDIIRVNGVNELASFVIQGLSLIKI
jgi:multiple sugar transport system substrate-binding protein